MTDHPACAVVVDLVEPIAAGDVDVPADVRMHLETCPRCASRLASARRIDAALASREPPLAPPDFAAAVLARVREEKWRVEERLDRVFNLVILACAGSLAAGVLALFNLELVLTAGDAVSRLAASMAQGPSAVSAAPSLLTWAAPAAFMGLAFALWWWTDLHASS